MSPTFARLMLLVLIFGAVMLAVEGGLSWLRSSRGLDRAINKRLRLIASGLDRLEVVSRLRRDQGLDDNVREPFATLWRIVLPTLHGAGLTISPTQILFAMLGSVVALAIAIGMFAYLAGLGLTPGKLTLIICIATAIGFGVPMLALARMSNNRRKKVAAQFPIALDVFVRGLRAGYPVASALELLTTEMTDPIGSEFGIVMDEVTYGADLRDALQGMANRWGLPDMQMFVVSLSVQSETGGGLAEILENLADVIRERANMFLKVRALSSEGRMTALLLTSLPILAFVGLFLTNPGFYLDIADDPAFLPGFGGLILLYFVGFFTIRRMVDLTV